MFASPILKSKLGDLEIPRPWAVPDNVQLNIFLTPFWNEGSGWVGNPETITSSRWIHGMHNVKMLFSFMTYSRNAAPNYFVNHLLVVGNNKNRMSGWVKKKSDGNLNQIEPFPEQWDHEPCVIITPYISHRGGSRKYLEVLANVTKSNFAFNYANNNDVSKGSYGINWLAVRQDIPRHNKNGLDDAFAHLYEHFPQHVPHFEKFRHEFEDVILRGAEPSEAMKTYDFDFIHSPSRKRSKISPETAAIATVCFDAGSLLINAATALKVYFNQATIDAIRAEIEAFGAEPSEGEALLKEITDEVRKMGGLFKNTLLSDLQKAASDLKVLSGIMIGAGLIKGILVAIYKQLEMPVYKIVLALLTILAQVIALVVTEGLALLAWIARIVALLLSGATLISDSYDLWNLEQGKT